MEFLLSSNFQPRRTVMKSKQAIALLLLILGWNIHLTAQLEKGTWQLGIGAGFNTIKYEQKSFKYSLFVSGFVEVEQKNSTGFQGNLTASYQASRLLQVYGGFGVAKAETHATINSTSSIPLLGTTSSMEKIDQQYVLLEMPICLRLHLKKKGVPKYGVNLFLDAGAVYRFPIVDSSQYQKSENGNIQESRKIGLKSLSLMSAVGLAIGDNNTLAFNWSTLRSDIPKETDYWLLSFTHFFGKSKQS